MSTILDTIDSISDLKRLSRKDLPQLAAEIREYIVKVISLNGGHMASSLGAVELAIALHRVFDSPRDKIIWDVGHQSYAHKILTGRKERFATIRQYGGLSGFPLRSESPHDAFGTGHAGTSISAALGMALARDLNKDKYHVIAVIGDGSLGTGLSFEAINHAGHLGTRLIVVLNDNGVSISPSVGALSRLLNRVRLDGRYARARNTARAAFIRLPLGKLFWSFSNRLKRQVEGVILPNTFWEEMGFTYLGPLDGHDVHAIETALIRARDFDSQPTVIHVLTQKGKGYPEAETDVVKYHGVSPNGSKNKNISYSEVFGQTVCQLMQENEKIIAISAAMLEGTGLAGAARAFPDRVFDVGICEQHAVTLAAGMATQGFIPIVAVYSSFLQRSYDQIIHDVCTQNLPVIFAIDRSGIVGEDGKTHHGPFDISFLRCIPNMVVAAPADEGELQKLLYSAVKYQQPVTIRYPKGNGRGLPLKPSQEIIPIGKGEIIRNGKDLTILAIGSVVDNVIEAAKLLVDKGLDCTVINSRFVKPLDTELILRQAQLTRNILTVEENTLRGGFGSAVEEMLNEKGLNDYKIRCLGLPDEFIEHGPQDLLRSRYNIDTQGIIKFIERAFPELCVKPSVGTQR